METLIIVIAVIAIIAVILVRRRNGRDRAEAKIENLICEFLRYQIALMGMGFLENKSDIPAKAKDNWSLGYVGGCIDAFIQKRSGSLVDRRGTINENLGDYVIMTYVFSDVYGEKNGETLFEKFMMLQKKQDKQMMFGMMRGGSDVFSLVEENISLGWAEYMMEE